ncbi:hypothetical protein [Primorskyibacter sp. 2E233]|uniref:hypothetical protein n=1 Tax=Primorskyibacter sp. 2E233 TaxID=3413431 RepID=UPI003BF17C86
MKFGCDEALDAGMALTAVFLAAVISVKGLVGPLPGGAGTPVLVVASPWGLGAAQLVIQAGGRLVGPYQAPFSALAVFDDPEPREELLSLGAWMVRDGRFVATLCGEWKE